MSHYFRYSRQGKMRRFDGASFLVCCSLLYLSTTARPDSELGALRFAPSSTPTPIRSTNSPPNQPVTSASNAPASESITGNAPGLGGLGKRASQLAMNKSITTTLPKPCHIPIALALVPLGIASQSINPKSAAASPPMTPAAIDRKSVV